MIIYTSRQYFQPEAANVWTESKETQQAMTAEGGRPRGLAVARSGRPAAQLSGAGRLSARARVRDAPAGNKQAPQAQARREHPRAGLEPSAPVTLPGAAAGDAAAAAWRSSGCARGVRACVCELPCAVRLIAAPRVTSPSTPDRAGRRPPPRAAPAPASRSGPHLLEGPGSQPAPPASRRAVPACRARPPARRAPAPGPAAPWRPPLWLGPRVSLYVFASPAPDPEPSPRSPNLPGLRSMPSAARPAGWGWAGPGRPRSRGAGEGAGGRGAPWRWGPGAGRVEGFAGNGGWGVEAPPRGGLRGVSAVAPVPRRRQAGPGPGRGAPGVAPPEQHLGGVRDRRETGRGPGPG